MQEYLNEAEIDMLSVLREVYLRDYNPTMYAPLLLQNELKDWYPDIANYILKCLCIRNYIMCTAFDIHAAKEIRYFDLTEKALNIFNTPQDA